MTINELMQDSKYKSYINVVVIYLERRFGIEIPLNVNLFNDRFEVKYGDYVSSYISHNAREYIKIRNRYGIIFINLYKCNTAEKVAETLIHEFTHYKQDLLDYNKMHLAQLNNDNVAIGTFEDEAYKESMKFTTMIEMLLNKDYSEIPIEKRNGYIIKDMYDYIDSL